MLQKELINAIKKCDTEEQINNAFDAYSNLSLKTDDKISYIRAAKGNPKTIYSPNNLTPEELFICEKELFLTGSWKIAERLSKV